jgi:TrmH family RNA methyltransferase
LTATRISSLSNPLIKRARAVHQRKARLETGLFVVEGLHNVGEALAAGWEFDVLFYAPDILSSEFGRRVLAEYPKKLQPVSSEVMESLAEKDNPQGILGLVRQRHIALPDLSAVQRLVAMVAPQDPGNVGTVLRTMDAVGADALFLVDGGVEPYHPTCVRASMGALFWKPVVELSFSELIDWSRMHTVQLIGTSAHSSMDYRQFTPAQPWMLILGTEQKGLSDEQLAACDARLSLPMRGRASSLNVAVAAGILLYRFTE